VHASEEARLKQGLKALDPVSLPLVAMKPLTLFARCWISASCIHLKRQD